MTTNSKDPRDERIESLERALSMFMGDMYRWRNKTTTTADAWALVDDLDGSYDSACLLCPDMLAKAEAENRDEDPDDCDHTFDAGICQHCGDEQTTEERRAADAANGECSYCGRDLSEYPEGCPSDDCPSLDTETAP